LKHVDRAVLRERLFALILRIAPDCELELREDADLLADLGLESVQLLELVCAVEKAFSIELDEADVAPMRTLGELLDGLAARLCLE
jgi:acyl carrier protein